MKCKEIHANDIQFSNTLLELKEENLKQLSITQQENKDKHEAIMQSICTLVILGLIMILTGHGVIFAIIGIILGICLLFIHLHRYAYKRKHRYLGKTEQYLLDLCSTDDIKSFYEKAKYIDSDIRKLYKAVSIGCDNICLVQYDNKVFIHFYYTVSSKYEECYVLINNIKSLYEITRLSVVVDSISGRIRVPRCEVL